MDNNNTSLGNSWIGSLIYTFFYIRSMSENLLVIFIYILYFLAYYYNWFPMMFTTVLGKVILILSIFALTLYHSLIGYITAIVLIYLYHNFFHSRPTGYREGMTVMGEESLPPIELASADVKSPSPAEILPEATIDTSLQEEVSTTTKLDNEDNIRSKPSNRYPVEKSSQNVTEPFASDMNKFIAPFSSF
jgi:hypothetical protein